nr:hypothetical protein [Tanacetum cinerariifolium]
NCPKCGNPIDGHFCQGFAFLRKKFKEDLFTYVIIPDPEPFNNQTVDELPQTVPCFNPTCYSKDGNSFTYDSRSNLVDDSPNIFNQPLQPLLYLCIFCRNDARDDHYCTPQVLFIYPKPCYNQDFNFPQDFHDFQQHYLCCENYGVPHEAYQCQPMNEDYYHEQNSCYYPNSFGFDQFQTPQYTINHPIFNAQNDLFNSQSKLMEQLTSIDDPSFYDEDIPKKIYSNLLFDEEIISMKIDSHHFNAESDLIESLLNHDSSIIFSYSKIDSLFDEFVGELTLLKSIPPGINETDCDQFIFENSDTAFESFSLFPIPVEDSDSLLEEIDLSFTPDDPIPPGIEEDDYDSERDILILEELLSNDSLSLSKNESFHFDIPSSSRPPVKPPDGNTGILNVKVMGDIFEHKVPMPRLMFTQPTLVPNQEESPNLLSHQGHEAFHPSTEGPMMIYGKNTPILDVLFFHFYPTRSIQV